MKIVQGLYGEIVIISAALELFIIVSLFVRYILNIVSFHTCPASIDGIILASVVVVWFVYLASYNLYFLYKRENLYLKREEEYLKKESTNENQTSDNDNATIKEFPFWGNALFCKH